MMDKFVLYNLNFIIKTVYMVLLLAFNDGHVSCFIIYRMFKKMNTIHSLITGMFCFTFRFNYLELIADTSLSCERWNYNIQIFWKYRCTVEDSCKTNPCTWIIDATNKYKFEVDGAVQMFTSNDWEDRSDYQTTQISHSNICRFCYRRSCKPLKK